MSRKTTLEDVARAAGVSIMTVSNVINGKHAKIGAATLERVQTEIKRLNYRPHHAARSLRLKRTSTIGMIIVHESPFFMSAPFISMLVTGVTNALEQNGYNLVVQGVHPDRFAASAFLQSVVVDGIVACLAGDDTDRAKYQKALCAAGLPLALVQDRALTDMPDTFFVRQDDYVCARSLAELAIRGGARRLLFLKPEMDWPAMRDREEGIKAAALGHEAAVEICATSDESLDGTQRALAKYLSDHAMPDAILGSNDNLAIAALKLVQAMGLRVPDDIVVTGFNAIESHKYPDPTLTTVRSQAYEMGHRVGTEMIHRLAEGRFRAKEAVLACTIVIGASTRTVRPGGTRSRRSAAKQAGN